MLINLKVKTLDAQTHEFSVDNEVTIREFKDKISEKTNIAADQQRIIYCGRVLADEKKLKEYDVDGKVLHVAERPPPSQRGPSTSNSTPNEAPNGRERPSNRGGMRNSPFFRALDGMVVGTMAIPMNSVQNNAQPQANPFAASSSFCMNRITVARHMLDCANNIAAYLEDPDRGLNNTSLDILARGSWTMESTVVEVGFSASDLPQNQNLVEMVQDVVSAALHGNNNTNVTVVQLPPVFGSSEGEAGAADGIEGAVNMDANVSGTTVDGHSDAAAVIIEDVIDDAYDGVGANVSVSSDTSGTDATNYTTTSPNVTTSDTSAAETPNASTTTGTNTDENPSRRRTNTRVLAEVVEQMRTVQIRLNPFIQQFYELLNNDPSFEEENTTSGENAQRLYNRVSEALHYMSHAQHAISDLMLDVSQPAPRFLTCRPILVEQSGYVSSNTYLSAAAAAATAAATGNNQPRPRTRTYISPRFNHPVTITTSSPPTTANRNGATSGIATVAGNDNNSNSNSNNHSDNGSGSGSGSSIEDPVDEPIVAPNMQNAAAANAATQSSDNPQVQMSRLIHAMVNSAPVNTELHLQILPPTIVSVPVNARTNNGNGEQQQQPGTAAEAAAAATNGNATVNSNMNGNASGSGSSSGSNNNDSNSNSDTSPPAARAGVGSTSGGRSGSASLAIGTLPTTSTQTRSTSRPQLQIGGIPANGWNGRFIPANVMSSFDRFLPCNSHHIHEPENGNNRTAGASAPTNNATPQIITTNMINPRPVRTLSNLLPRGRPTTTVGGAPTSTSGPNTTPPPPPRFSPETFLSLRNLISGQNRIALPPMTALTAATTSTPANNANNANPDTYRRNLRTQLLNFISQRIFDGGPINADTVPPAVNRAVDWFGESLHFLPQYEKPEYDSRHSVANILRFMLPLFIEVIHDERCNPAAFEQRIKQICEDFVKRLYSVLNVCVGRSNAELYWAQLMRLLLVPIRSIFRDEALHFLCIYINTDIPSTTDTADAQQFIVHRNVPRSSEPATETFVSPPPFFNPQSLETDVEMAEVASTSEAKPQSPFAIDTDDDAEIELASAEPLPSVTAGSESWHRNFPNDWLPIITRDIRSQAATPPTQTPFSDAYISGMSAKRRKMIQNNKPPTDVSSLVARSVRKAVQTVGVRAPTADNMSQTTEEITEAIASDTVVHASYTEAVRTNVRDRLKKDTDYKPEKYPQTAKFINK